MPEPKAKPYYLVSALHGTTALNAKMRRVKLVLYDPDNLSKPRMVFEMMHNGREDVQDQVSVQGEIRDMWYYDDYPVPYNAMKEMFLLTFVVDLDDPKFHGYVSEKYYV